jgi:hypothetical protein
MLITFVVYAQEFTTCSYGIVLLYNCVPTSAYRLPLPLTTPQSTDFKYPRFFICFRPYSYCLSNSLFIAAASAIEAWIEIQCCQISDVSSTVKTLLSGKRQHVSSQISRSIAFNFSFLVESEKKLEKQFNILLLFGRILLSDCNKNKRIIDLYVCYGCYPQHMSQWYDKHQQKAAES